MNEKLDKYENDEISEELMIYLRRHMSTSEHKFDWLEKPIKMVNVEGKSYILQGNKKYLVGKIYHIVDDRFEITEKVARRTIKKFLDGIS